MIKLYCPIILAAFGLTALQWHECFDFPETPLPALVFAMAAWLVYLFC